MNRARAALCGAALAVCAAGAAADDDAGAGVLDGCAGSLAEHLEAIETEFPAFRSNEVGLVLRLARGTQEKGADVLGSSELNDRDRRVLILLFCSLADDVGAVGAELRNGFEQIAEVRWRSLWTALADGLMQ